MVGKLFKHEFLSYAKVMSILYIVLVTSACSCWVLRFLESNTVVYKVISALSSATYNTSAFAAGVFSFALGIIRFYRNLFTAEGYLTLTLPVTVSQHIVVKAVTAVAVNCITGLIVFLAGYIASGGETVSDILALLQFLTRTIPWIGGHGVFFLIEIGILILVSIFSSILLCYTFICIGQLFKKHRILAAVGAYFAFYIVSQVGLTVLTAVVATSTPMNFYNDLGRWMVENPSAAFHTIMWGMILLDAAFAVLEFVVIRYIITRKLNLE